MLSPRQRRPTFEGGVLEQESLSLIARYDEKLLAFLMRSA